MSIADDFVARRNQKMVDYVAEIDSDRKKIGRSIDAITPHFVSLKESGDNVGYILLGTSLVERQIINTVKAHVHAFNVFALLNDISTTRVFAYHLDLNLKKRLTAGNAMKILEDNFDFKNNHQKLHERTNELIKIRNNIAHQIVDEFEGDINRANSELNSYAEREIVENVFNGFTDLMNFMSKDLSARFDEIRKQQKK
jgi:hypothetical protein